MTVLDLHNHTTASDGSLTPTALIERAHRHGITGIAVTDHDTFAGLDEAKAAGRRLGVEVYSGIEISATRGNGGSLHVLGYCFDIQSASLNAAVKKLRDAREGRNINICAKLTELGMPIKIEELEAIAETTIGRPHFAKIMLEKGYVDSANEAFDKWLSNGRPAYADKEVLSPAEAIEAIHSAGGLAVLAHPLVYAQDAKQIENLFQGLAAVGLDGVEVYYGSYSAGEITMLRCLADRHGLIPSGGSDFHTDPHPLGPGLPDDVTQNWKSHFSATRIDD
jgi:3',5'-nucleoside bisphosphate phosphatase